MASTSTTVSVDSSGNSLLINALDSLNAESDLSFWGLSVDALDNGLAIDTVNGLATNNQYSATNNTGYYLQNIESLLANGEELLAGSELLGTNTLNNISISRRISTSISSGSYSITPQVISNHRKVSGLQGTFGLTPAKLATTRYQNIATAQYYSSVNEEVVDVDGNLTHLDLGGNFQLQSSQYATYDVTVNRRITGITGAYVAEVLPAGVYINGAASVIPEVYNITGFPVVTQKNNILSALEGLYDISSWSISTKVLNKIVEGKYVVDSANYYSLYIDEGTDYSILVDTTEFGIDDTTNIEFSGKFARHTTSAQKYDIIVTKTAINQIKLNIPKETTVDLYGKYIFDIMSTRAGNIAKVIQGNIIINEMVTR